MKRSLLVRLIGFPATLIHGDTLVLDRWLWLRLRLVEARVGESLLDVGCGSGAFAIGAARRGYDVLGLSWDAENQLVAQKRADMCGARTARFEVFDVRCLGERRDLANRFDVVLCTETIEHILDDRRLLIDIVACLKPGGRLLLTTPNLHGRPMTVLEATQIRPVEDGGHVRKGYDQRTLTALCADAGAIPERFSFCSGIVSQRLTAALRWLSAIHPMVGWIAVLPLRIFPPLVDRWLTPLVGWPYYSIALEARKPA